MSCNVERGGGGEGYPDERHAIVRDGRKRTTLLNLMMKDSFSTCGLNRDCGPAVESLTVGAGN